MPEPEPSAADAGETPSPEHTSTPQVVVISPCRDEAETLGRTIACMAAQTHPPAEWVVVDDGSSDRTPELLAKAAEALPWLRVVRRGDRGSRRLGAGVIDAFYEGLDTVQIPYTHVAKVDMDLEFPPRYLERILAAFDANPALGAASGKVYRREGEELVEEFLIDEMVAGQFKLYRRDAFEGIGGFVREVMWDGIDFHRARMAGYETCSLPDPELRIIHLRQMGSSDRSVYRGRLRWGRGQWFMGSSFAYVLASALFRMREKPYVLGGLLIAAGYLYAGLRGDARYDDPQFRRGLRSWQRSRLRAVLSGSSPRSAA